MNPTLEFALTTALTFSSMAAAWTFVSRRKKP